MKLVFLTVAVSRLRLVQVRCCALKVEEDVPLETSGWTNYLNKFGGSLSVDAEVNGNTAAVSGFSSYFISAGTYLKDRSFRKSLPRSWGGRRSLGCLKT